MRQRRLPAVLAALLSSSVVAEQPPAQPPPPLPQDPPAAEEAPPADAELAPEVTIIERGENVIHEYRLAGRLLMVKVIPAKGPPYYLIDSDGDGSLETVANDLDNPPIAHWRILTW